MTITMGRANRPGRFMTLLTRVPQKPFSTSSRVFVFWVFSVRKFSHQTVIRRTNGTNRATARIAVTLAQKITMPSRIQNRDPSMIPASRRA